MGAGAGAIEGGGGGFVGGCGTTGGASGGGSGGVEGGSGVAGGETGSLGACTTGSSIFGVSWACTSAGASAKENAKDMARGENRIIGCMGRRTLPRFSTLRKSVREVPVERRKFDTDGRKSRSRVGFAANLVDSLDRRRKRSYRISWVLVQVRSESSWPGMDHLGLMGPSYAVILRQTAIFGVFRVLLEWFFVAKHYLR